MGHLLLLSLLLLGIAALVLTAMLVLSDFMDSTGWRPRLDWQAILFGFLAFLGFAGLAYVLLRGH